MAFFIKDQGESAEVFEMDATVRITYSQTGNPSKYAVESGVQSSDHYTQEPDTISFQGFISDVKFASRRPPKEGQDNATTRSQNTRVTKDIEKFQRGIQELKRSGRFFTCSYSDKLDELKNCLFQNLLIEQSTDETGRYALKVIFTIQQVIVANVAENVEQPVSAVAYLDTTEGQKKGSGTTVDATEREDISITAVRDSFAKVSVGGTPLQSMVF